MNSQNILEGFNPPRAKIDFIKLQAIGESKWGNHPALNEALVRGRLKVNGRVGRVNGVYLTLHDPTVEELKVFRDMAPQMMIQQIELSIDWHLKDCSNDYGQLEVLRRILVQNLYPKMPRKVTRKFYDTQTKTIIKDAMNSRSQRTTYWKEPHEWIQVRCYIKTEDRKRSIDNYSVRLEVTISQGALAQLGAHRICLLPDLVDGIQGKLTPFLFVAAGIKPRIGRRCRSNAPQVKAKARHESEKARREADRIWKRSGAMGAIRGGYAVTPDSVLNRQIGRALSHYKEKLQYGGFVPDICPEIHDAYLHEFDVIQQVSNRSQHDL